MRFMDADGEPPPCLQSFKIDLCMSRLALHGIKCNVSAVFEAYDTLFKTVPTVEAKWF